jgi:4-amino-4-deoxy-L-arabinose transferase-like glycosyltransferase
MKTKTASPTSDSGRDTLPLAGILLLALLLRGVVFAVAWYHSPDLTGVHYADTASYIEPAQSLLSSGDFYRHGEPELLRTPGYPLLLTAGIAAGHVEVVTIALQMLLSLVTVAVVYRLARSLTGSRPAAIAAGFLFAVEPLSLIYTSFLTTETLFSCLIVLMIAALVSYGRTNSYIQLTVAALLLAAATLVRPISFYLPPLIAMALLGRGIWQADTRWRGALAATVFLIASFGPTAAWQARNWTVAGYNGFSAVSALNLCFQQGASVVAALKNESLRAAQIEMGDWSVDLICEKFYELHPELRHAGQAATYRFMQQEGSRLVRQHPGIYAKIHLRGMLMLLINPGGSELRMLNRLRESQERSHPIDSGVLDILREMHQKSPEVLYTNLVLAIGLGMIYLTATLGFFGSVGRWSWGLTVLVLVAGYLVTIAGGPTGFSRMRQPVMPLACVFSGIGVAALLRWRTGRRSGKLSLIEERRVPPPKMENWQPVREYVTQ